MTPLGPNRQNNKLHPLPLIHTNKAELLSPNESGRDNWQTAVA
jgi:hypothetical protein